MVNGTRYDFVVNTMPLLELVKVFEDLPEEMRAEYLTLVEGHVGEVARGLTERRVDHELLDTSTPLDAALFQYLSYRSRRLKGKF